MVSVCTIGSNLAVLGVTLKLHFHCSAHGH